MNNDIKGKTAVMRQRENVDIDPILYRPAAQEW